MGKCSERVRFGRFHPHVCWRLTEGWLEERRSGSHRRCLGHNNRLVPEVHRQNRSARTLCAETQADGLVHTVGAADRDAEGKGSRRNPSLSLQRRTMRGTHVVATARTNGARRLTTMVAVGHDDRGVLPPVWQGWPGPVRPRPGIRVILPTLDGLRSVPIESLLPLSHRGSPVEPGERIQPPPHKHRARRTTACPVAQPPAAT